MGVQRFTIYHPGDSGTVEEPDPQGEWMRYEDVAALEARIAELEAAIIWACGARGHFPQRQEGQGAYWWRSELRKRAGISGEQLNAAALATEAKP